MDWGSLTGILLALGGVLVGQAMEGGHLGSLIQPAAFVIVFIGTLGAVLLQSGWPVFLHGLRMGRWMVWQPGQDFGDIAPKARLWSTTARREGLLSLQRFMEDEDDPFLIKGLRLAVDGIDHLRIREILEVDISVFERRQRQAVKVWEAAAGYAPTIGILGAVLGLIHVMENLSDPTKLGSGIAVAFVATIYGVGLANLVFLPIANRLKSIVTEQVVRREMMAEIFHSMASGDSGRVIEERLAAYQATSE